MKKTEHSFPPTLDYCVAESFASDLSTQNDSMLIGLLLNAMYSGINIKVLGNVSVELAYHLEEYIYLLSFRFPTLYKKIDIQYENVSSLQRKPEGVGTILENNVDTLFTLLFHIPRNQPIEPFQITHALNIRDLNKLVQPGKTRTVEQGSMTNVMTSNGIAQIDLETNLFQFLHPNIPPWHYYVPIIISSAHAMGGLFKRFYIPGTGDYKQLRESFGPSDPFIDDFLSSDTLDIHNHGYAFTHEEKVKQLSQLDSDQSEMVNT